MRYISKILYKDFTPGKKQIFYIERKEALEFAHRNRAQLGSSKLAKSLSHRLPSTAEINVKNANVLSHKKGATDSLNISIPWKCSIAGCSVAGRFMIDELQMKPAQDDGKIACRTDVNDCYCRHPLHNNNDINELVATKRQFSAFTKPIYVQYIYACL